MANGESNGFKFVGYKGSQLTNTPNQIAQVEKLKQNEEVKKTEATASVPLVSQPTFPVVNEVKPDKTLAKTDVSQPVSPVKDQISTTNAVKKDESPVKPTSPTVTETADKPVTTTTDVKNDLPTTNIIPTSKKTPVETD